MERISVIRAICAGVVVGWMFGKTAALADEPSSTFLRLEWEVAEGCPDRDTALTAIKNLLGAKTADDRPPVVVRVEITRLPDDRWEAQIQSQGPVVVGVRELRGPSCERLVEAVALVVAIALDPVSTAERVTVRESVPSRRIVEKPAKKEKQVPQKPRVPAFADEHLYFAAGLRAAGDLGSLPEPTMGIGLMFGLSYGRWSIESNAKVWLPQLALRGPVDGSGGRIELYSGGLRGCFDALQAFGRHFSLGPCLAAEVGLSTGTGINITHPNRSTGFWGAALAGLFLRQSAESISLSILAEAGVPLVRPIYAIENFDPPVFQASRVIGRVSLAAAWSFRL